MRYSKTTWLVTALLTSALSAQEAWKADGPAADGQGKIDLRVLVTGVPQSARLEDFRKFLSARFRVVETTSYSAFVPKQADEFDVVVFDAEIKPQPGRIGLPKPPTLPEDFARASVLVSGGGAILARPLGLKTDWG